MKQRKAAIKLTITAILTISVIACPLGFASYVSVDSAHAFGQFGTIPPETREFEEAMRATDEAPTKIPTVGPGSSFDEGDPNKPAVQYTEEGDADFGYGPLVGDDELYAVWTTDENGTHYVVVHKDSALLRGSEDTATGGRHPNGFDELVKQREATKQKFVQEVTQAETRVDTSNRSFSIGLGVALVGSAVCIFVSFGACAPLVAIGGGFLLSAYNGQDTASTHLAAATDHAEVIETLDGRLNERLENSPQSAVEAPQGGD